MEPVELCHILLSSQGAKDEFMAGLEDAAKKINPEIQAGRIASLFPGFLSMGPISLNTSMLEDGQRALYEGRLDFSLRWRPDRTFSKSFPCLNEDGLPDIQINLR